MRCLCLLFLHLLLLIAGSCLPVVVAKEAVGHTTTSNAIRRLDSNSEEEDHYDDDFEQDADKEEGKVPEPVWVEKPMMQAFPAEQVPPRFHGEPSNNNQGNPKCTAAGFYPHILEQDQYELQRWQDELRDPMSTISKRNSCKSATINARGTYTSHLVPCTFKFYQIEKEKAGDLGPFAMSTACQDATPMKGNDEIEEYVVKWPDECVADFNRCYLIERDEKILLRHMCRDEWTLPEGATHISVDCTADKEEKEQQLKKNGDGTGPYIDPYMKNQLKHQKDQQREYYAVLLFALLVCLLAGCISLCCTYRYVIKPYLIATMNMKRSRSDPELNSLTNREKVEVMDSEKGV